MNKRLVEIFLSSAFKQRLSMSRRIQPRHEEMESSIPSGVGNRAGV